MTPSAGPANPAAAAELVDVPARHLQDGEIVVLAMKPSGWFVPLTSMPVLLMALAIAVAASLAGDRIPLASHAVYFLCLLVALARVMSSGLQWTARLYVLTNRRVLRVRGVFREEVFECPLKQIEDVTLFATRGEKMLGLGSIFFKVPQACTSDTGWLIISKPGEIQKIVADAVQRARMVK